MVQPDEDVPIAESYHIVSQKQLQNGAVADNKNKGRTRSVNKDNLMYYHRYAGVDNYSEESTRRHTRRNADSSSATLDGGRVRREKIGSGVERAADQDNSSSILMINNNSCSNQHPVENNIKDASSKMSISGVFTSLYSNFVGGNNPSTKNGSSAANKPAFKESKCSTSARVNVPPSGSTFSSRADNITALSGGRNNISSDKAIFHNDPRMADGSSYRS